MPSLYQIGAHDRQVVAEFCQTPIGHHSPALQRVLNVLRGEPLAGKYVLICTKPHREWVLGRLSGERGKPVRILKDRVFTSIATAECAVFRYRWKKYTGRDVDE